VEKVAPTATARRKFVQAQCDFTWTNSGGTSSRVGTADVWLYLEPAASTTAGPPDVATVVQKAGRPAGPVGKFVKAVPDRKYFTGVAVMGIEWARAGSTAAAKPHFAVLVYNYHDAWASAKPAEFQLGALIFLFVVSSCFCPTTGGIFCCVCKRAPPFPHTPSVLRAQNL
jgi:hypothetical protein